MVNVTTLLLMGTKGGTLSNADALIIVTEWQQFRAQDFDLIKTELTSPLIIDGRNLFSLERMINDYYDPRLKHARLAQLAPYSNFRSIQGDIADRQTTEDLFAKKKPCRVLTLLLRRVYVTP